MRFCKDWSIGDKSLKTNFPRLNSVCFDKNESVGEILDKGLEQVQFRRTLYGNSLKLWGHIKEVCGGATLTDQKDSIRWTLTKNGVYRSTLIVGI